MKQLNLAAVTAVVVCVPAFAVAQYIIDNWRALPIGCLILAIWLAAFVELVLAVHFHLAGERR